MYRTSSARRKLLPSTMRLPGPRLMRVFAMELVTKLFGDLLLFVYHCFDRIVIHGYLSGLSRPEQVVHFFRKVVGIPVLSKEILSQRTADYQNWVEAFARNHNIPIEWAEKGVRKEDYVLPWLRRMTKRNAYGVYFIFKSMEQGPSFRVSVPKYPTKDPNHRILARQRSRFTHDYFYIRDEVLGPMVMRVATFFPFQTTYYLNGHTFIERELNRVKLSRFYAISQIEYCRNFIFKRNFPIHKLFERGCELGLWRLTAHKITEIFGARLHRRLPGKLATVIDQIEHGHHVFRAYFKHAFLKQYEKFATFLRLRPQKGIGQSRRRPPDLQSHHQPLRWLPGPVAQRSRRLPAFAADCAADHHRFGPLSRHQNPRQTSHSAPRGSFAWRHSRRRLDREGNPPIRPHHLRSLRTILWSEPTALRSAQAQRSRTA